MLVITLIRDHFKIKNEIRMCHDTRGLLWVNYAFVGYPLSTPRIEMLFLINFCPTSGPTGVLTHTL